MKKSLRNRLIFFTTLGLGLSVAAIAGAGKKAKNTGLLTVANKNCGYWIRYPKDAKLEHPSDCALRIDLPSKGWPVWLVEASLTLYAAAPGPEQLGEAPAGEATPAGYLVSGRMKFAKTVFLDAAMSHRFVTVMYEGMGKNHRYLLEGFLKAVDPAVLDPPVTVKDWDPEKSAEKIFDGMVLNFRPLE